MKQKWLLPVILPLSLLISPPVISAVIEKPAHCPTVSSIQSVGLSPAFIERWRGNRWVVKMYDQSYDTDNHWTFGLALMAPSSNEAYKKALKALTTLTLRSGPDEDSFAGWYCMYQSSEGYPAMVTTAGKTNMQRLNLK